MIYKGQVSDSVTGQRKSNIHFSKGNHVNVVFARLFPVETLKKLAYSSMSNDKKSRIAPIIFLNGRKKTDQRVFKDVERKSRKTKLKVHFEKPFFRPSFPPSIINPN